MRSTLRSLLLLRIYLHLFYKKIESRRVTFVSRSDKRRNELKLHESHSKLPTVSDDNVDDYSDEQLSLASVTSLSR